MTDLVEFLCARLGRSCKDVLCVVGIVGFVFLWSLALVYLDHA